MSGAGALYPRVASYLSARYDGSPQPDKGDGANIVVQDEPTYCLQGNGIDRADTAGCNGRGWTEDVSYTLNTIDRPAVCAAFSKGQGAKAGGIGYQVEVSPSLKAEVNGNNPPAVICLATQQGGAEVRTDDKAPMLTAAAGMSGNNQPVVYDGRENRAGKTVCTITGDHEGRITDYTAIVFANQRFGAFKESEQASCCTAREYKDATDLAIGLDCEHNALVEKEGTLRAHCSGGAEEKVMIGSVVRRLTPLECDRLQGYPDNWTMIGPWTDTKGKTHETSDANRYKADGNSIALPFWFWLLRRISAQYERPATLGSLFDGIGGFPLCWERCNGKGTARWASEIEEFPIAVTKYRFGED